VLADLPADSRVARFYPDDGHIAAKNKCEWGPAAWAWLRGGLTQGIKMGVKPAKKKVPVKKVVPKK